MTLSIWSVNNDTLIIIKLSSLLPSNIYSIADTIIYNISLIDTFLLPISYLSGIDSILIWYSNYDSFFIVLLLQSLKAFKITRDNSLYYLAIIFLKCSVFINSRGGWCYVMPIQNNYDSNN